MGLLVAVMVVMTMVVTVLAVWAMHMRFGLHRDRDSAQSSRRLERVVMVVAGVGMPVVMSMVAIVSVVMTSVVSTGGVSAVFWLKRFVHRVHDQVHGTQHVGQHVIGLNLQVVGLQLNGHMPVAQMVGRADQVERCAMVAAVGDLQHRLRRGLGDDERAVFGHQHIATAHHSATGQKHADLAALAVGGVKTTFLAHVPIQLDGGSALDEDRCQTLALGDAFGDLEHMNSGVLVDGRIVAQGHLRLSGEGLGHEPAPGV